MFIMSVPIETNELCYFGCGQQAKWKNKSEKLTCCKSSNSCPENKRKNSEKIKQLHQENKLSCKHFDGKRDWAKGLTKETNEIISRIQLTRIKKGYVYTLEDILNNKYPNYQSYKLKNV